MKKLNGFSLLYLGVCIVLLLVVGQSGLAQQIRIIATDGVGQDTVILGLNAAATNHIDPGLGEEEQPPLSPTFDYRSVSNGHTVGRDTCLQGLKKNFHRLVTVTQTDQWKLQFQSDANGSAVNFSWTILNSGANGWELEDGQAGAVFPPVDMVANSSFVHPVNSTDPQVAYVNYYDGTKLRTATSHELADAPDAKGHNAGKPIKQKADKYLQCFTISGGAVHTTLHLVFSSVVVYFPSLGGFGGAANADLKGKDWVLSGGAHGDAVIICVWVKGGKAPSVAYGWDADPPKNKTAVLKPGGVALNPMPNWWNVIIELFNQGVFPDLLHNGKVAGLHVGIGNPPDDKTGKLVYHPKYGDIYKTLFKKGTYQDNSPDCLSGFDPDRVAKMITKPQKSLPPDKHNNKLLGDAVAFRVNLGIDQAAKVSGAAGILATLKYKHPGNPFDGKTVSAINDSIDAIMACGGTFTPAELDVPLAEINNAFSGSFDTVAWAGKLILKGVKAIGKSGVLYRNSLEAVPVMALPPFRAETQTPLAFKLEQNYPNPFNPTTTIDFTLPAEGIVTLKVYNLLGQEVATLLNHEQMDEGDQTVDFDASALSSGVYYYRLILNDGEFTAVRKMMLLK
ncbi:MAG: T9SS type A sorting domain-containing protein [Ignavibacteriae bacterium]|nr:T9SS type A sorting domain-containing protein [Ignavibacteria bacterium]MBI3365767.1 T9SS type A sorting domain-containing protein [Ignavibacteriota bacterium]